MSFTADFYLRQNLYGLVFDTSWGAPIRVRRVVVVHVACRVDIPRVVRVATVGTAQARVLRYSLRPYLKPRLRVSVSAV